MGFELKLVVGTVPEYVAAYELEYGRGLSEIASTDLSSPGYDSQIYKMWNELNEAGGHDDDITRFLYGTDSEGNETHVYFDRHGSRIFELDFKAVKLALVNDAIDSRQRFSGGIYRRFDLALAILDVIESRWSDSHDRLAVYTWAH